MRPVDAHVRRMATEIGAFGAVTGYAFLQFFPHRSDYAGHFLAGLGATLVLLGCVLWILRKPLGWVGVAAVVIAVLFGALTESTIFRIAIFDPVDFFNQSLGAVSAGWLLIGVPAPRRTALTATVLGVLLTMAGFVFAFT